jgi:hypothetical protein
VSNTATQIVAKVPVDATNGPLTVTTAAGTSAPSTAVFKPLAKITGFLGDPAQVGDTVTVSGYDFTATGATPTVKLGTLTLTPGTLTATSFTASIPDGALTGSLTVSNANGSTSATLHVRPTISADPSPTHGPAGTAVTLTGAAFTGTSKATIGGVTASFVVVDYHHLRVTVPAAATSGPIAVTNAGGTTSSATFTVDPKITSFTPTAAAGLASVTITGSGLGGATAVNFNGDPSPQIVSNTATQLVAKVPVDASNGPITVTSAAGTSAPSTAVFKPLPKITGFTGDPAQVGDTVTVNGYDFAATGASPTVKLGTLTLSAGSLTATGFTVTIPDGALTGSLTVSDANGSSSATLHVRPTISADPSPTHGPAATVVTLTGTAFTGTSKVTVGGAAASFAVVDYHHLHVTIPAAAVSGAIAVTNAGGTSTDAVSFIVDPKITSFTPTSGPTGTALTLTGSGLAGATAVDFGGGVSATPTSSTATTVKVVVPAGALTGAVSVHTASSSAIATSGTPFTVTMSVTAMAPAIAAVGDQVVLTGVGLTGASTVRFNGVTATFQVDSATQITATVPTGSVTGTVTVTKSTFTVSAPKPFTLLTLTNITPSSAAPGGTVTINGSGFTDATAVSFNGHPAENYTVNSDSRITATVPAGFSGGASSVSVTALGGATITGNLTLLAINGYTPDNTTVGTQIEIDGSGFTGATDVSFNGTSASFNVVDDTHITATVPTGATTGPVTVTGPGGITTGPTFTIN